MKPASSLPVGLLAIGLSALLGVTAAQADDEPVVNKVQLPRQTLPTGEGDAPAREAATSTPAALFAAPVSETADAAQLEAARLEVELLEMTSESDVGLEVVNRPDGSSMVDLQGRFMSVVIATPTADGGYTISCHEGGDAVAHAKHAADIASGKAKPVTPQKLEEK